MNKENKNRPTLRFPEFEGEWEETTLGEVATFRRGSFPQPYGLPKWYDDEKGIPFIQVYDVDDNLKLKQMTKRKISKQASEQSVFIEKGTVIVTIQGSIGRVAITQYDAYIDRTLLIIQDFLRPIDKIFFAYVLQMLFKIEKQKAPGGIIKTITKQVLTHFNFYIPNIKEQQKIAACLSSLDDLMTAHQDKLTNLKNHKKGLLQNLFPKAGEKVPRLRFDGFKGEWEETTLNDVAQYINGKAHEKEISETGRYKVVNSKFVSTDGEVVKYTNSPNLKAAIGDILMVLSDVPNGKAIAKCFYVDEYDTYTVNQRICKITPTNIVNKFLIYILNRNPYFLRFDDGVKQTNLRKDNVLSFPFLKPKDPKEQQKIAACLSSLDDLISAQEEKIKQLHAHKKGLLQGLFPKS